MAKKNFKGTGADLFLSAAPEPISSESSIKDLKINSTFKELIPELTKEEYAQLEENLLEHGIREAISLWGDTIIDGHNRYEIAQKHNLEYKTVSYAFNSEDDVMLWIFKNQVGRRNLPLYIRVKLALNLKPIIAEKAKEQQIRKSADFVLQNSAEQKTVETPDDFVLQNSAEQMPMNTRNIIADISGVSHDTVSKVEKIVNAGTPDIHKKIQNGEISIHKAYQDIKRQEKRDEITASVMSQNPLSSMDGKYDVLLCDCSFKSDINNINAQEIPAADNSILFMWASATILKKAIEVMSGWGFEYQTCAVWDKMVASRGSYLRSQHELLLIGIKGKYAAPPTDARVSSLHSEKLDKTSKKPDYYYKMIEEMCPDGTYLELFAHKPYSSKWTVWGNKMHEEGKKE